MKFQLTQRPAQIGPSINVRTEKHGEENVPAVDIPVTDIFLDKDEFNGLMQDEDAHDAFFTDERGKQLEPRFQGIAAITLSDKFTGARVTIKRNGSDAENLVLKPAKIAKVKLEPQVGGLTLVSFTVQGNPSDHTDVLALLNCKCRIQVIGASLEEKAPDQPELGLDHVNQGEGDAPDPADGYESPLSRKIAEIGENSKKKKGRRGG
jgi:hypothetical protein